MSFYRTLAVALAAVVITSPVFADDATTPATQANPSATQSLSSADQTQAAATKVNINGASVKDLVKIKGLNTTRAKAIVAYRKKHGQFTSLDQLASVKGFKKITASKLKSIKDQITID